MAVRSVELVLLLCLCLCVDPLWGQQSAAPLNVASVSVKARTETALTLEWIRAINCSYTLRFTNGTEISLPVSAEGSVVTHTVSPLSPGTKHTFLLYTILRGVRSSGFTITAVTTPANVASVAVKARSETGVTLEWNKVGGSNTYSYILRQNNKSEAYAPMYWGGSVATHTVSSLSPGIRYNFTLYTVFGGERSSGYNFSAVTMPLSVAGVNVTQRSETQLVISWEKANSSNISYILSHRNRTETSITDLDKSSLVNYTITSLSPGTRYTFTLYTVFEGVRSRGLNFSSVTASLTVSGLRCEQITGGSGLGLVWTAPGGVWMGVEVLMAGRGPQYSNGTRLELGDLRPARWYNVTLKLYSGDVRSAPVSIRCLTDPRGVIAGAVLVVLFIIFLCCLGVCVKCRQCITKRKTQRARPSSLAPIEALEEGVSRAPVQAKPQTSVLNKQLSRGTLQENPYRSPRPQ